MNIEGTPHERALLVICAYIIGFTSSFIAFNYATGGDMSGPVTSVPPTTQTATVIPAQPEPTPEPAREAVVVDSALRYENDGLYLHIGEEFPVLLSKDIAAVGYSYDDLPDMHDRQGFHTAVPGYEHFADAGYVYYCEQYDSSTCAPMLYDVDSERLHFVRDTDGEPVELTATEANDVAFSPTGFQIAGHTSVSTSEPWVVTTR